MTRGLTPALEHREGSTPVAAGSVLEQAASIPERGWSCQFENFPIKMGWPLYVETT